VKTTRLVVVEVSGTMHPAFAKMLEKFPSNVSVVFDHETDGTYFTTFGQASSSWSPGVHHEEYNWLFLKAQQNYANDLLNARGYIFLNDVLNILGLPPTPIGQLIGWDRDLADAGAEAIVNFGCWDSDDENVDNTIDLKFYTMGVIEARRRSRFVSREKHGV
jgi:hypothetical protein